MTTLACDYSFAQPPPAAIKAAGYVGVLRYLSTTPAKNLSAKERDALHAAGLGIGLAWETTATRATQGETAGRLDARAALAQAQALGYPPGAPIYFAVDEDVAWSAVQAYFQGAMNTEGITVGAYGSLIIVNGAEAAGVRWRWQTEAWSATTVSPYAHLYQRVTPTLTIPGGGYDEDVVLVDNYPWWTVPAVAPAAPIPAPTPTPSSPVTGLHVEVISVTIGKTGNGWTKPAFTVNEVMFCVPVTESPDKAGHYTKVAQFDGITAEGELVFAGGSQGTFNYRVWLAG